jgi:hypothetical protein
VLQGKYTKKKAKNNVLKKVNLAAKTMLLKHVLNQEKKNLVNQGLIIINLPNSS